MSSLCNYLFFKIYFIPLFSSFIMGFPGGSDSKESSCNEGDLGWEDPPGEGNGNPLQYSCLENPID